jgi:hypothetical protein
MHRRWAVFWDIAAYSLLEHGNDPEDNRVHSLLVFEPEINELQTGPAGAGKEKHSHSLWQKSIPGCPFRRFDI